MNKQNWKTILNSRNTILLIIFIFIYVLFNQARWKKENAVIEWDVISYYAYLPATFIYQDITLDFIENYQGEHKFTIWYDTTDDGEKFIRTSLGLSYLYSPFFFLGHLSAHLFNYDTGGYSLPYKFFLQIGSVFFLFIGLLFLRKILLLYFKDSIVAITLIIISIFTNLGYYTVIESGMAHVYNFSLITVFVFLTIKWHEAPNIKKSIILGLLYGLISLIRPTNAVVIIFFGLFGINNFKDFKDRVLFFIKKWQLVLILIFSCIIPWIPQFLYWKIATGHFLFYSYEKAGGSFYFNNPQIINGLFSYRKGWFLYTPAMFFSLLGLLIVFKKLRTFFIPIIVLFLIFIYVTLSWWCWWYGGGLSIRPMIDIYGILAIPLATFISWMMTVQRKIPKYLVLLLFVFVTLKSGLINFQYKYGIIHFDSMTKETYWPTFFKIKKHPAGFWNNLCIPDYELAKQGIYECNPIDKNN